MDAKERHYSILDHALACKKSKKFKELHLKVERPESKRYEFMNHMCDALAWHIGSGEEKIREIFNSDYLKDFFLLPELQYDTAKEADLSRILRVFRYLATYHYKLVASEKYQVSIEKEIHGTYFSNVYGNCYVYDKGGAYAAVIIRNTMPKYSKRARRPERKVEAALELLLPIIGLSDRYPGIEASIIYLNVENEREESMHAELPEKNIVTLTVTKEQATGLLEKRLSLNEYLDCESCKYASICNLARKPDKRKKKDEQDGKVPVSVSESKQKEQLTKAQEQIVNHRNGPLCCVAVPGAGKTHSLVRRLEEMVKDGISPKNILFITFTRKAAKEIQDRVSNLMPNNQMPVVSTFHAFAFQILRDCSDEQYRSLRLAEKIDELQLIERVLQEYPKKIHGAPRSVHGPYGLLSFMHTAFSVYEKKGKEEFSKKYFSFSPETILEVYAAYKALYKKEGYISYDEMVPMALEVVKKSPSDLKRLRQQYQYIMADEFQDVSPEQAELLYLIAAHGNIVVVGDDDQTIYSWRGGTNRYLLEFLSDWPEGKLIRMEDNFRSTGKILSVAEEVICENSNRITKQIIPHKDGNVKPVYLKGFLNDRMPWLLKLATQNGYKLGDIAILSRKNNDLKNIAGYLEQAGVPYLEPKKDLIEDDGFLQIYDVLTLYYEEMRNDISLYRFFTMEGCGFEEDLGGSGSLYERMVAHFLIAKMDPYMTLDEYLEEAYKSGMTDYGLSGHTLLKCFKAILYSSSIEGALNEMYECLGLKREELDAVSVLLRKVEEKQISSMKELYSYMKNMVLYRDDTEIEYPEEEGKVTLLTCHKAKGKEYPMVIIHGVEHFKSSEEDRCILYVAMTRAKRCLYMTEAPFENAELLQGLMDDSMVIREIRVVKK